MLLWSLAQQQKGQFNGLEQQARNASIPWEQQAQLCGLLSLSLF